MFLISGSPGTSFAIHDFSLETCGGCVGNPVTTISDDVVKVVTDHLDNFLYLPQARRPGPVNHFLVVQAKKALPSALSR